MDRTISPARWTETREEMHRHMDQMLDQIEGWMTAGPRDLKAMEEEVLAVARTLGAALLTLVCQLLVPR